MKIALSAIASLILTACSTAPVVPQPHYQKPVTCMLTMQPSLQLLTPEFITLSGERIRLESQPFLKDEDYARMAAIDQRQARILLGLHAQDGVLYKRALTRLDDCQDFIERLP